MNDNFNLRQFLTENRLTKASQVLAEAENPTNVGKWKGTPSRGAKTENTTCKYSLQEVRKNYRKFLREGIGKRKAIALLSKVYPGLNLMEALMDDSRTRSLRESGSRDNWVSELSRILDNLEIKLYYEDGDGYVDYDVAEVYKFPPTGPNRPYAFSIYDEGSWDFEDDDPEGFKPLEDFVRRNNLIWVTRDGEDFIMPATLESWNGMIDYLGGGGFGRHGEEKPASSPSLSRIKSLAGRKINFSELGLRESLREAGYTDDEDFEDLDLDIDIDDPKARAAAEKAMRAAGEYEDFGDDPEDRPEPEEDDDEEAEAPAKEEPKDELHAKGHWDIKYDPETVTLNFEDDEDLQDYLNGFRRPKIAAKYLQRKLDAAQYEIDEEDPEIGAKKTYLQLKDGLYFNYPFKRSDARLIATVRRHKDANI